MLSFDLFCSGREYDKFGNLHQWWENATIEKFNERAQCITDQYSNFSINDEHVSIIIIMWININSIVVDISNTIFH